MKPRSASFHNLGYSRRLSEGHHDRFRLHRGEFRALDCGGGRLMPWIPRGLREGIVTSRYPHRPDGYGRASHARGATRRTPELDQHELETVIGCPTRAITREDASVSTRAVASYADGASLSVPTSFLSARRRDGAARRTLLVPPDPDEVDRPSKRPGRSCTRVKALRRSIHLRHVDADQTARGVGDRRADQPDL